MRTKMKPSVPVNEMFIIDGGCCGYSGCSFLAVYVEEFYGINGEYTRINLKRVQYIYDTMVERYRALGLKVIPANKVKE